MSLAPGTSVGRYRIVAALGAGGMGEVYRALDTRLKREVALKVLPASVLGDPDRRRRFLLEAEATAALSHPRVAAISTRRSSGSLGTTPGSSPSTSTARPRSSVTKPL